jgi:hypothetical protein
MATTPPKGGGTVLTRKFGPLPGWAWAGLGVAGFFIYKQRKASKAAAAGTSSTATDSTAATAPIASAPSGYGYQGPSGGGGPGWNIGTPPAATGSSYVQPTGETLYGSGYGMPGGSSTETNPLTGSNGTTYVQLSGPAQVQGAQAAGTSLFFQPTPGTFSPAPASGLAPYTPIYIQQ